MAGLRVGRSSRVRILAIGIFIGDRGPQVCTGDKH